MAVTLRHNHRFIYFVLFLMADPSPPFMPTLMTQAFKKGVPLQSKHKLLLFQNILYVSLPPLFSSFRTPIPILLRLSPHVIVPVKSPGSSHCKGKEAIYDPPVKQETSEEAVYFELDHSDEEEVWRDYVLPSPSRVWLAFCQRNLNVSWASVSSSIFDLVIRQGISLPMPIHFELGWVPPWVGRSGSIASYLIRAS